jgi:hypothetical protein
MLTELLDRDPRTRIFGELGDLFDDVPRHHRLRDPDEVRRRLARSGAVLNVVKPLVESHRCNDLFDLSDDARAVWMFRHYRDVASSNLRRFGMSNGIENLRPIVEDRDDWRRSGLSDGTRAVVTRLFDSEMAPHDAAALFWWCRNTLFFDQRLDVDQRVRTCRYEQLVADPDAMTNCLYAWIGIEIPDVALTDRVHDRSVGKGDVDIGAEIDELCDAMWLRLTDVDATRSLLASS